MHFIVLSKTVSVSNIAIYTIRIVRFQPVLSNYQKLKLDIQISNFNILNETLNGTEIKELIVYIMLNVLFFF